MPIIGAFAGTETGFTDLGADTIPEPFATGTGGLGVTPGFGAVPGFAALIAAFFALASAFASTDFFTPAANAATGPRGVTLAAHILLAHGREASAIELLLIGVSSLRRTVGEDAARLLEVQLEALHEQFGEEKYERLCQDILDARAARKRLERPA